MKNKFIKVLASLFLELRTSIAYLSANNVVLGFSKSGRTWLKVIFANVRSQITNRSTYDLEFHSPLNLLDNFGTICIGHAHFGKGKRIIPSFDYISRKLKNKKVVFLIRDPRDVIVSYFHQKTKREDNEYASMEISDFIKDEKHGIPYLIDYMNRWSAWLEKGNARDYIVVRYEDMREDTEREISRIMSFFKIKVNKDQIKKAVDFASFDNMKKMEKENRFNSKALQKGKGEDVNSFKTRKGKVGGYKEELSSDDVIYIESYISDNLSDFFCFYK